MIKGEMVVMQQDYDELLSDREELLEACKAVEATLRQRTPVEWFPIAIRLEVQRAIGNAEKP